MRLIARILIVFVIPVAFSLIVATDKSRSVPHTQKDLWSRRRTNRMDSRCCRSTLANSCSYTESDSRSDADSKGRTIVAKPTALGVAAFSIEPNAERSVSDHLADAALACTPTFLAKRLSVQLAFPLSQASLAVERRRFE